MPAPGPHPDCHEVHGHARDDPPVIGIDDSLPQINRFQCVQAPPQEHRTNKYANPELPFFHENDFTMWREQVDCRLFGNLREVGKEVGVLGGLRSDLPNTPCLLPH